MVKPAELTEMSADELETRLAETKASCSTCGSSS